MGLLPRGLGDLHPAVVKTAGILCAILFASAFLIISSDPHRAPPGTRVIDHADRVEYTVADGNHLLTLRDVRLSQDWRTDISLPQRPPTGLVEGRYLIGLDISDELAASSLALLIPRVAQTVSVAINGVTIYDQNEVDAGTLWRWNTPVYFKLPAGAIVAGSNDFEVRVVATFFSTAGLSKMILGEPSAVRSVKERLLLLQDSLPLFANIVTIAMALPLFMIWFHGRRIQSGPFADYGLLGIATALFGIRSLHVYAGEAPLPMTIWLPLVSVSLGVAIAFFSVFLLRFAGLRKRWIEWALVAFVACGSSVQFAFPESAFMQMRTLFWYVPMAAIGMICMTAFCVAAVFRPSRDRMLIATSLLVLFPTAIHDVLWVRGQLPFESILWLPLTMPGVLFAISATVANRFARDWVAADRANRTLRERVAAAEENIRSSFDARLAAERREATASERAMLIEDLHDGVGNRLALLLSALQTSSLPRQANVESVRACLDDLRMIITARDTGTLVEALAEYCHLQAPLVEAAGITLELDASRITEKVALGPKRTLELLRLVQEAVSNCVHHGSSDRILITLTNDVAGSASIRVCEIGQTRNPTPSSPHSSSGRGLASMRARASRIGGELFIIASSGHWSVELRLPLDEVAIVDHQPVNSGVPSHTRPANPANPAKPKAYHAAQDPCG